MWTRRLLRFVLFCKLISYRSNRREVFCKKGVVKNFAKFTGKHLLPAFFLIKLQAGGLQLYLKETRAQVFFCEFCGIFKNTVFCRTPPVAAFVRISKSTRDDQKINFIIKLLSIKFFCIRIGGYALKRHTYLCPRIWLILPLQLKVKIDFIKIRILLTLLTDVNPLSASVAVI